MKDVMSSDTRTVAGACPLDCPDTCGWIVTVAGDKAVDLRGNPEHPFTRGALCNKVADVNATVQAGDADMGKGALYHDNACR
jgi:anaerobic selenocysteine-containing dehydrogenase